METERNEQVPLKTCPTCKTEKPITLFGKYKTRKDGRNRLCFHCAKIKNNNYYKKNRDHVREIRREKYKYTEKDRIRCIEYRKNNPERVAINSKKWVKKNPEKINAQRLVNKFVRSGIMYRYKHCQKCEKECITDGHHPDYSKPLHVVWLCHICHRKEHRTVV